MPKPTHSLGGARRSGNPLSQLLKDRKERRKQKKEQASKSLSNDRADVENKMVDMLASINFVRSPIPAEILDSKTDPNQPWGDLELGAKAISNMIRNAPNFTVDISEIDVRLLQIVNEFKSAVDQGNVRAAYAAKSALIACITNVRNRVATVPEHLMKGYVENAAQYVEIWVQLVDNSRVADLLEKNVEQAKAKHDSDVEEMERKKNDLKDKISNNEEYLVALADIKDKTASDNPMSWTEAMRTVREMMLDQRFDSLNLNLSYRMLMDEEIKLRNQEGTIDILSARVANTPIPEDPDAINKFKEQLDNIIGELAEMDTEIDEMLTTIENIEGQLSALDTAPGAVHIRNAIADQAEQFVKNVQLEQDREVDSQGVNRQKVMDRLGIRSEEEQQAMVAQAERERAMQVAEAMKMTNTNSQKIYVTE